MICRYVVCVEVRLMTTPNDVKADNARAVEGGKTNVVPPLSHDGK